MEAAGSIGARASSWLSRVAVVPCVVGKSSRIATNRQLQTLGQCRSRRFTASLPSRSVLYFVGNVVVTIRVEREREAACLKTVAVADDRAERGSWRP